MRANLFFYLGSLINFLTNYLEDTLGIIIYHSLW